MVTQYVSVNRISGALHLGRMQLNRLALKIGLEAIEGNNGRGRELSFEESLSLVLSEACNRCADIPVDIKLLYEYMIAAVERFGARIDEVSFVFDRVTKTYGFLSTADAVKLVRKANTIFIIIPIRPYVEKLASLFGKKLMKPAEEAVEFSATII